MRRKFKVKFLYDRLNAKFPEVTTIISTEFLKESKFDCAEKKKINSTSITSLTDCWKIIIPESLSENTITTKTRSINESYLLKCLLKSRIDNFGYYNY